MLASDCMNLDLIRADAAEINLVISVLANVGNSQVGEAVLASDGASIEVGCLDGATDPVGVCAAGIFGRLDIQSDGVATHVLAEEKQRPPDGLFDDTILASHERRDDVDGLCDIGHAHVFGLADEGVQEDRDSKGVGECVLLFRALLTRCADRVPDVPLVEADCGSGDGLGDLVLDASQIDESAGHLDCSLSSSRRGSIGQVLIVCCVDLSLLISFMPRAKKQKNHT